MVLYLEKGKPVGQARVFSCPHCEDGAVIKRLKEAVLSARAMLKRGNPKGATLRESRRYKNAVLRLIREKIIRR